MPGVYWQVDGCNFVIFKTGDRSNRCQFFHRIRQQYGTGTTDYDDPTECIVSLLQAQAGHAATESGDL